ncbi:hypothetical protein YQE_08145, partial [Dendroctonus ponderosae]
MSLVFQFSEEAMIKVDETDPIGGSNCLQYRNAGFRPDWLMN